MRRQNAFTLVELLVVIGIIAVLVSVLLPSLNRARDAALRVKCAGNLQQWGVALTNYMNDNRGDMPRAWGQVFNGVYPYTYRVRTNGPDTYLSTVNYPAVLSLEMMRPYLKGVPVDLSVGVTSPRRIEGVWRCPASMSDLDTVNNSTQWDTYGWVYGDYAYFGRSDLWTQGNAFRSDVMTNPEEIMDKKPSANRLWMCDVLFRWAAPGATPQNPTSLPQWDYNHRRGGVGGNFHGYGASVGNPALTGMNQLFGDGHVVWKEAGAFNLGLMAPPASNSSPIPGQGSHFVRGGGNDCSFY